MEDDIEQRVIAFVTRHSGVYIFRKKKYDTYTAESSIHFDVRLDICYAEELMEDFFKEFNIDPGAFQIETYYPNTPDIWNLFKKTVPVSVPDFTIAMLIESAKAGKWLYD